MGTIMTFRVNFIFFLTFKNKVLHWEYAYDV